MCIIALLPPQDKPVGGGGSRGERERQKGEGKKETPAVKREKKRTLDRRFPQGRFLGAHDTSSKMNHTVCTRNACFTCTYLAMVSHSALSFTSVTK